MAANVADSRRLRFLRAMHATSDEFEIVTVASGVQTVRSLANCETFHPVVGPMVEARGLHVAQQQLVERASAAQDEFVIWDVGLGAAANAIAVIEAFAGFVGPSRIELHSFDCTTAPLAFALTHREALGYVEPHGVLIEQLLAEGEATSGAVVWHLHRGDFREQLAVAPAPHAILYDPYSPRTNAELWTLEFFTRLAGRLDPQRGCLWSNYTRSTAVRVTLLLAGFFVGAGAATGEKEETTLAANDPALLTQPLDAEWLERVRRSTKGAPLRAGVEGGPISDEDFAALKAHAQFC